MGLARVLQKQIKVSWPRSDSCGVYSFTESLFTDNELKFLCGLWAAEFLVDESTVTIQQRIWPRIASRFDVYWDEKFASCDSRSCKVFFSFPKSAPGFMTINYVRTGPQTGYQIIAKAVNIAEQIAIARSCQAIVCQVISSRISARVMRRWGYVPHAQSVGNGHFIRRLES